MSRSLALTVNQPPSSPNHNHPDLPTLTAYHRRHLDPATTEQTQHHLLHCRHCRSELVELAAFLDDISEPGSPVGTEVLVAWETFLSSQGMSPAQLKRRRAQGA
jgi:hypothetical protein